MILTIIDNSKEKTFFKNVNQIFFFQNKKLTSFTDI